MDALIALLAVVFLWLAFRKIGWWSYFWLGLALYLAFFELASKIVTGHTISQQFWTFSLIHPIMGWIAVILVALGGIGLAIHLAWRMLRRNKDGKQS